MRKYKQSEIRAMIAAGMAEDITAHYNEIQEPVEKIGYSVGVYGINGGLLQGKETGKFYAVPSRCTALFYHF